MTRKRYPADLTAAQWQHIEPHVPAPKDGGRPSTVDCREIVNAILYVVQEGCRWRALPQEYPKWQTVYHYFRLWRDDVTWQRIHDALRDEVRAAAGREPSPSAAILDAQSVKTVETGYPRTGGGPVAGTMPASRSQAASATSLSIRSGCS
jgi:putative transposase